MCVQKLDKKTLDKICEDAIDADKSSAEREVKSYESKSKEKHYEPFNYEYVDWRGKIPYIPAPNEKKRKKYEPVANGQLDLDGT